MATLPTKSQGTIVALIASGMQGAVSTFLNFAAGAVFLAIAQAYSGPALWLQSIGLAVAKLTRLATSFGSDADSFVADFGIITRLGAQAATGLCTFSRFTPGPSAPFIPVGSTVQTGDGTQQFTVTADPTNPAYSALTNGYTLPAQVASVILPVQAVNPGTQGNVAAGTISQIVSSLSGVDTVVNVAAFINGINQESDAAFKTRFQLAIASLSKGTETAIRAAIGSLEAGIQITIQENLDLNGNQDNGMVTIVIDDGSGNPSATLVAQCAAAADTVRCASIRYGVYGATTTLVSVNATITTGAAFVNETVVAQVVAAIAAQINSTGLGNGLDYFDIPIAARAVPGCTNISNYTLNGAAADLPGSPQNTFKAGVLTIS